MTESEDIYTFYREQMDPEFAQVWTRIIQNPNYTDSCDVQIICSDGYYCDSHKCLLSVSSQGFRNAFQYYFYNKSEELSLDQQLVITLPEFIPSQELESIINYIYIGFVTIPESRLKTFLDVSKFLGIKGLEDIILVFVNQIDDSEEVLSSGDSYEKPNFEIDSDESESETVVNEINTEHKSFTKLKSMKAYQTVTSRTANLVKKKYSSIESTVSKRVGVQGRRPQKGSPLITEEFRAGDRYQCKVCGRKYLWKKSLVRHYKDLHPDAVELVQ